MSKSISIEIPHNLSQDQVKERISSAIDKAIASHGSKVASVTHTWAGNLMSFSLKAMGQSLSGTADVLPQSVKIDIDLPWALSMFGGTLKNRVEAETRAALEDRR